MQVVTSGKHISRRHEIPSPARPPRCLGARRSGPHFSAWVEDCRLENIWARQQTTYLRQGERLANASAFFAKVQSLIDKASSKGWDTSAIQAALNALRAVIPAVQAAHTTGAVIIANHAGFDASGKVTDRSSAVGTVKSMAAVLQATRATVNGTGQALREAIRAFRQAHPRPVKPTTPAGTSE